MDCGIAHVIFVKLKNKTKLTVPAHYIPYFIHYIYNPQKYPQFLSVESFMPQNKIKKEFCSKLENEDAALCRSISPY